MTLPIMLSRVQKNCKPCAAMASIVLVQLLRGAGTLLMQREIPEDVNLQAAQVH